jgi:hypothetical protein
MNKQADLEKYLRQRGKLNRHQSSTIVSRHPRQLFIGKNRPVDSLVIFEPLILFEVDPGGLPSRTFSTICRM